MSFRDAEGAAKAAVVLLSKGSRMKITWLLHERDRRDLWSVLVVHRGIRFRTF